MKTKIYLDYNIFVNYIKGFETYSNLEDFKDHYSFFYGPPYLEEVANIKLTNKQEEIDRYIVGMNKLFEGNVFLPVSNGDIIAYKKDANEVYNNVISDLEATKFAESMEYQQMSAFKKMQKEFSFNSAVMSNETPNQIFYHPKVQSYLDYINMHAIDFLIFRLPIENAYFYLSNHRKTERLISALFNVLESIGYKGEKIKKTVSRLHDVSHAIYATKADIFVTCDARFAAKCQAVYEYAGVPTRVMSYEEFLYLNIIQAPVTHTIQL